MKLSYFHVAGDVPLEFQAKAAVVIDVLRATTTIACALSNGAEAVQTFSDISELKKQSSSWPADSRILIGERGGKCLEGFDLGNSPVEVVSSLVSKKRIFMSTTNGTRALEKVNNVDTLYAMGLVNRKAIAERLLIDQPDDVCILGSGWEGSYSMEDSLAAGALAAFILENGPDSTEIFNDELNAALALWSYWKHDLVGCLRATTHGQRLEKIGNHDADFKCCADLDKIKTVPIQAEVGVLRPL